MKSAGRLAVSLLVASAAFLLPTSAVAGGNLPRSVSAQPSDAASCGQKLSPPPAVDESEDLAPGETGPEPLPVPDPPVGGVELGCGYVLPPSALEVPGDISAQAWMVADLTTSQVLGGRDVHGRYRPASTLKLLTVLVVLPHLPDRNQVVEGTDDDANQEGSRVGMGPGGRYTVTDLMLGLLLNSGNDTANALARANGGTEQTLAEMNATAAVIGALDTRAATVSGLDGPGQQTSAYDLGLIIQADLALPGFAELLGTDSAMFPGFGDYPAFGIANENKLLTSYAGAVGGKTGFTNDAGNTYVGVAERNGHRLMVTMLAGTQQPRPQWMQAASLLDWGFSVTAAGLAPVGRLVQPGEDLNASDSSAAPSSAAAAPVATSASSSTTAPSSSSEAAALPAAASQSTRAGWVPWLVVGVLILAGAALLVALRFRRSRRSDPDPSSSSSSTEVETVRASEE